MLYRRLKTMAAAGPYLVATRIEWRIMMMLQKIRITLAAALLALAAASAVDSASAAGFGRIPGYSVGYFLGP
jgi:hypothetical protein